MAPDKTKITHIDEGFDFLGFNIKRYKGTDKSRVLIKASKDSIKSFKRKAKEIVRNCYPNNIEWSVKRLNYLINGVGNYWRMGSNKRIFSDMDNYLYEILFKQTKRWHQKKSIGWIVNKYFKISSHTIYKWKWTFTDPKSGIQVDRMSWIKIRYPKCARHKSTPYDEEYEDYIIKYRNKTPFECLYG